MRNRCHTLVSPVGTPTHAHTHINTHTHARQKHHSSWHAASQRLLPHVPTPTQTRKKQQTNKQTDRHRTEYKRQTHAFPHKKNRFLSTACHHVLSSSSSAAATASTAPATSAVISPIAGVSSAKRLSFQIPVVILVFSFCQCAFPVRQATEPKTSPEIHSEIDPKSSRIITKYFSSSISGDSIRPDVTLTSDSLPPQ